MLLQTNSYIVPKEKRAAHNHLMQRFRQVLMKIGCDHFEVYEQVGANWAGGETSGRFVQMMKFRDRKHCQAVQLTERKDPAAQALVREFCELINFAYQEQQGLFAHGYYNAVIEPIRIKPSDLAYHAYDGEVGEFDPARALEDPQADSSRQDKTKDESIDSFSPPRIADNAPASPDEDQSVENTDEMAIADDENPLTDEEIDLALSDADNAGDPDIVPGDEEEIGGETHRKDV